MTVTCQGNLVRVAVACSQDGANRAAVACRGDLVGAAVTCTQDGVDGVGDGELVGVAAAH